MCRPNASAVASVMARASVMLRSRSPRASRKDDRRSCVATSRGWRDLSRPVGERLSVIGTRGQGFSARHSPLLYGLGKPLEYADRGRPVDAGVRDALAVAQGLAGGLILPAGDQMALHHDAADAPVARLDLLGQRVDDEG